MHHLVLDGAHLLGRAVELLVDVAVQGGELRAVRLGGLLDEADLVLDLPVSHAERANVIGEIRLDLVYIVKGRFDINGKLLESLLEGLKVHA